MYNDRKKETIRTRIKGIRRATDEANKRKYSLFDKTLEHHMSLFRSKFLVGICIFDLSGKRMFDESSVLDSSSALSEIAYNEWEKNIITPEQFREVARTSPWTSYWSPFKEGVFGVSASHLNDKQRTIVMFSKMYDNAHQSMECPPDEVFEDDDMFDGWMIKERRDGEKTRKQKRADNSFDSKHSNAGEVFFSAESQNEANKIIDLNEFGEKMRLRRRSRELEVSEGPVKEQELTDVKMKLRRQLIEEVTNKK